MRRDRGMTTRGALALVVGTAILAGCAEPVRGPAPTPTTSAAPSAAAGTPVTPIPPQPPASPTPSGSPTAPAGPRPPAGYAQSCAKDVRWGVQVAQPFLCLDAPVTGARVTRGAAVAVRGWAGGSFENNVVLELWTLDGGTVRARLVQVPVTYVAPDAGMPGGFERTLTVPATAPRGPMRLVAHFDSPRDGSVVRSASVDIVIE